MNDSYVPFACFDNADPGAAGWLVLAAWFVLFVFILNTIIFFLRRLFRRARNTAGDKLRRKEKRA